MKTVLFSPCYLEGQDWQKNDRLERNIRYIDYYSEHQREFGFEKIALLDNGSSQAKIDELFSKIKYPHLVDFKTAENLKCLIPNGYSYVWRGLYYADDLIKKGYKKIINIDSDVFVLTQKMAHYIRDLRTGWNVPWSNKWEFPESSINILCHNAFPIFYDFIQTPYMNRVGDIMERVVPFTHVERAFKGDRYGEEFLPITDDMDYYGQMGPNVKPVFKFS